MHDTNKKLTLHYKRRNPSSIEIHAALSRSLRQLDILKHELYYLALTTEAILLAAHLWAEVRRSGQPTADSKALDGDVILAAQVQSCIDPNLNPIVATTNVTHIERLITAQLWETID